MKNEIEKCMLNLAEKMVAQFEKDFGMIEDQNSTDCTLLYYAYHFYWSEKVKPESKFDFDSEKEKNIIIQFACSRLLEDISNFAKEHYHMSSKEFHHNFHKWNIINNPEEYSEESRNSILAKK